MTTDVRERIERYITNTPIGAKQRHNYTMSCGEIGALFETMQEDWFCAICMAFNYGLAKGYRAAKAGVKK